MVTNHGRKHGYHCQPWFNHGSTMVGNGNHSQKHGVLMYFQVCSNSAYPQYSGERYRTNGPLVQSSFFFFFFFF